MDKPAPSNENQSVVQALIDRTHRRVGGVIALIRSQGQDPAEQLYVVVADDVTAVLAAKHFFPDLNMLLGEGDGVFPADLDETIERHGGTLAKYGLDLLEDRPPDTYLVWIFADDKPALMTAEYVPPGRVGRA